MNGQSNQSNENKNLEKSENSKKMSKYFEIQKRRRKVKEQLLKGMDYQEIADKLGVSYYTVRADAHVLKKNSQESQVKDTLLAEKVKREILEKLSLVEKTCWELFELREVHSYIDRADTAGVLKKLGESIEKCKTPEEIAKKYEEAVISISLLPAMKIPPEDRVKLLGLVNKTIENIAKVYKIIGVRDVINIDKQQINIQNLNQNVNILKHAINIVMDKYVPEEKRMDAIKELKSLDWPNGENV